VVTELDLDLGPGRVLHVYDTGPAQAGARTLPVLWHHGTPNLGSPPEPLFGAAARLGLRWVSYDRPGCGGSTPWPDRDVASAATCAAVVADTLGLDRLATAGHSGGGPHALACAALLPHRVVGALSIAGLAPYGAEGLDWFDGMAPSGVASLRASLAGRAAKVEHEASAAPYDPEFTPDDLTALDTEWAWLGRVATAASAQGPGGLIDDDLAYVAPWGFDPARITVPVQLVHGNRDRVVPSAHSRWLADRSPTAELVVTPEDGHISVLRSAEAALARLVARLAG